MIIKIADNIYSPLGQTTDENFEAIRAGRSALKAYTLPDGTPYTASLFPAEQRRDDAEHTFFERLCIRSAERAIAQAGIDPSADGVLFFLSTTKANVHLLDERFGHAFPEERVLPGKAARAVSEYFGNRRSPIVVSNACISGLSAQIIAARSIEAGVCQTTVVVGCDVQSDFIISGFNSLHALAAEECRPFDKSRCGLNLGEAAATLIYTHATTAEEGTWILGEGAMCNDANHISGPSRTGEGSFRCIEALGANKEEVGFVSVHGTSTLYNDEMESIALDRAGLSGTPMFSLKGYYGHTMGAAGVLETILSMKAIEHQMVYATRGYAELGVSREVSISPEHRKTEKRSFIKLLSGFGGCNAAMLFRCAESREEETPYPAKQESNTKKEPIHSVCLRRTEVCLDGETIPHETQGAALLTELYRSHCGNYMKFFKMDPLAKLGFIGSELLLKVAPKEEYGVLLFNRSSSLADDRAYQATIHPGEDYFPSPALFVYTLPNIVTGEIAIRNHYLCETNFLVLEEADTETMAAQIALGCKRGPQIAGWAECSSEEEFEACMMAVPQGTEAAEIKQALDKMLNTK